MVYTHPPVGFSGVLKTVALETVLLQSLHECGQISSLSKLHSPQSYTGDNEYLSHRIVKY